MARKKKVEIQLEDNSTNVKDIVVESVTVIEQPSQPNSIPSMPEHRSIAQRERKL